MAKLDIRPLLKATFELTLSDDETLHLTKPTEPMLTRIADLEERHKTGEGDLLKDIHLIDALVQEVLELNVEKRKIPDGWVQSLPLDIKMVIINEYVSWAMQFNSPNSSAPPSQTTTETAGLTPLRRPTI